MPNTSSLTKAERTFRERSTGVYSCVLEDENGDAIPSASLDSVTLTLRDLDSGDIINLRNAQDVLNANNVTIHATNGTLTWTLQSADNALVDTTRAHGEEEVHRALFEYTWGSGTKFNSHEITLFVVALDDVP